MQYDIETIKSFVLENDFNINCISFMLPDKRKVTSNGILKNIL